MNTFYKMEDDPKFLREQLESVKEHCAEFLRRADVLKELLTEEVESNKKLRSVLKDTRRESKEWQRKYYDLHEIVGRLQPGQRLTKEVLNELNRI